MLVLAGGGTAAGLALSSTPANAAQAVALNAAMTAPGQCTAAAGGGARGSGAGGSGARGTHGRGTHARGARTGHKGCLKLRLRQVKGMHGEMAFHTASGTQTLAFERGAITSTSSSGITVRAADGTRWTWTLTGSSLIRKAGRKVPVSQLTTGIRVFVGGQLDGSSRDARLVLVHKAKGSQGSRSQWPSGSGSSGSSASGSGSSGGSASGSGSSGNSASGSGSAAGSASGSSGSSGSGAGT